MTPGEGASMLPAQIMEAWRERWHISSEAEKSEPLWQIRKKRVKGLEVSTPQYTSCMQQFSCDKQLKTSRKVCSF